MTNLLDHLAFLYGAGQDHALTTRVENLIAGYRARDSIPVTYGDQVR